MAETLRVVAFGLITALALACQQTRRGPVPAVQSAGQEPATANEKLGAQLAGIQTLPDKSFEGLWDEGFVKVQGTWVLDKGYTPDPGLVARPPVQTTTITCVKEFRYCFEATAVANAGNLLSDTTLFEIERWDVHEVITKPREAAFGCETSTIRINRDQQTVNEVHNTFNRPARCSNIQVREQHFHFVDGADAMRQNAGKSR